jgi:hypothetical protein
MKKLTASNDADSQKPKQGVELRALDSKASASLAGKGFKKIGGGPGLGKGFTKIGGGFKKVGTTVGKESETTKEEPAGVVTEAVVAPVEAVVQGKEAEKGNDVVMEDVEEEEEEAITWEEYDFTKPTGCDHATCGGCKTEGIWSGGWVAV